MGRTSLTGGYSLEYLQDITLSGLQRLAKIHGLDENMQVQELIQELRAESDDEEDDAEYADNGSDFFDRKSEGEDDAEEEEEQEENNEPEVEEADEAKAAADADESVGVAATQTEPETSIEPATDAAAAATLKREKSALRTVPPFVPSKSEKSLTLAKPFAVGQPLSARGEGGANASLKSLEAAARKREDDQRKAEAAEARRVAAAARRERISTAFTEAQANVLGGGMRINNKPRPAWDDAEKLAAAKEAAKAGQATRRQQAESSARG